ncbi:MAG TPA: hypothetical protein VK420_21640 [Longimicrobium sp.]|nr:hypothetical protein [Longimicrobium sp.]
MNQNPPSPDASVPLKPDASATPMFLWVAIIFAIFVPGSWLIAYLMLNSGEKQSVEAAAIQPPVAFESSRLVGRIERLENDLRQAGGPNAQPKGASELKVLRIRAETVGTLEELQAVTRDVERWEGKFWR